MSESTGPAGFPPEKTALVAVLRRPRDLEIAAQRRWYRIPVKKAPKRRFTHLAFYQPACFEPDGKRIVYYAEVAGRSTERRIDLLPGEPGHPAARELYLKYSLGPLLRLPLPILNTSGSRVSFGYAPLERLSRARDIPGVFNIFPLENMMCGALRTAGLDFRREYVIMRGRKIKYRLDFALLRKNGKLDVECDGRRCHSTRAQRARDRKRDKWLRRNGWTIIRFREIEVVTDMGACLEKISAAAGSLEASSDVYVSYCALEPDQQGVAEGVAQVAKGDPGEVEGEAGGREAGAESHAGGPFHVLVAIAVAGTEQALQLAGDGAAVKRNRALKVGVLVITAGGPGP